MAKEFMDLAFEQAEIAFEKGEIPVGAVLVSPDGKVVVAAHNETEQDDDATAHAEILCLRRGGQILGSPRLADHDMYVTLEPCAMCAAAISFARIRRLYFAAYDEKMGGVDHGARFFAQPTCHHAPEIYGGIQEQRGKGLMQRFFEGRR